MTCLHFLRHMAANYSFLFYGHSLEDKDLLATLDAMVESFGQEVTHGDARGLHCPVLP